MVEGTDAGTSGSVWVLDGATGAPVWHEGVTGRVIGSVVSADLTGSGYQDLLVPTTHGVEVLDGRSGAEVTVLGPAFGFQNSPLVTDDPNGTVGITIAGYNGSNEGVIEHFEIPGSDGSLAVGTTAWPMFHHDPSLSGASSPLPDLGTVTPGNLTAQGGSGQVSLSWSAPPGGGAPVTGYNVYEATARPHAGHSVEWGRAGHEHQLRSHPAYWDQVLLRGDGGQRRGRGRSLKRGERHPDRPTGRSHRRVSDRWQ